MKNILLLRENFSHMGAYSGYDKLFSTFNKEDHSIKEIRPSAYEYSKNKILNRLFKLLGGKDSNLGTPFYRINNLNAEKAAIKYIKNNKVDLVHISCLENNYACLGRDEVRNALKPTKIIATVHQPPSWWKLYANPTIVKTLDGLIVLSEESKVFFETYLPNKTYFIPHGVDTNFFFPLETKIEKEKRCIFSGQWLRDIPYLIAVIEKTIAVNPAIQFDLVYPSRKKMDLSILHRIAKFTQVHWYQGISDDALRSLYQQANLLFLPLLDAAANNAILESMACGLPVITTDLQGVKSYTNTEFAIHCSPSDPAEMSKMILNVLENEVLASQMGKKAREKAVNELSWSLVAKETWKLYESICK